MIKRNKKKKGQNVAEYAILIALVVGAIIAMQKFAQRGLQGRVRDATEWMVAQGNDQIGHSTDSTSRIILKARMMFIVILLTQRHYAEKLILKLMQTLMLREMVTRGQFMTTLKMLMEV